jgi:hypothetical protein
VFLGQSEHAELAMDTARLVALVVAVALLVVVSFRTRQMTLGVTNVPRDELMRQRLGDPPGMLDVARAGTQRMCAASETKKCQKSRHSCSVTTYYTITAIAP